MNKKISLGVAITLVLVSIALTLSVTVLIAMRNFDSTFAKASDLVTMHDHLAELDRVARQSYYLDVNGQVLRDSLANGYVAGMGDSYAAYLTSAQHKTETDRLAGTLMGIGLQVALRTTGEVEIVSVQKSSPAAATGLQKGDVIISFDGTDVTSSRFEEIRYALYTSPAVRMSVSRNGSTHVVEISAGTYGVTSVEGRMLYGGVGVINIRYFYNNTPKQFESVFNSLEQQGAQSYIIDVRNNVGGTVESVTGLCGMLLAKGVYAESVDRNNVATTYSAEGTLELTKPTVILVNGATAGEAELFAAALKQYNSKVNIVGTTTAGKGMMQKLIPLDTDGSAIKMSVAKYYLQDKSTFDGVGITPDVVSALTPVQENQFAFLTDDTDPQLASALTILNASPVTSEATTAPEIGEDTTAPESETTDATESEPTAA